MSKFFSKDIIISVCILIFCILQVKNKIGSTGFSELDDVTVASVASLVDSQAAEGQKKVVIFETSWCGVCSNLKKDLTRAKINFESFDIEKDYRALDVYKKIMGKQAGPVPVTVVDRKMLVGGQASKIISLSQKNGVLNK